MWNEQNGWNDLDMERIMTIMTCPHYITLPGLIWQTVPCSVFKKSLVLHFYAHHGGSVWESNPPIPLEAGQTGFEVRRRHQPTCTPNTVLYRIDYAMPETNACSNGKFAFVPR